MLRHLDPNYARQGGIGLGRADKTVREYYPFDIAQGASSTGRPTGLIPAAEIQRLIVPTSVKSIRLLSAISISIPETVRSLANRSERWGYHDQDDSHGRPEERKKHYPSELPHNKISFYNCFIYKIPFTLFQLHCLDIGFRYSRPRIGCCLLRARHLRKRLRTTVDVSPLRNLPQYQYSIDATVSTRPVAFHDPVRDRKLAGDHLRIDPFDRFFAGRIDRQQNHLVGM